MFAILASIGLLFVFYGYEATWRLWNVPTFMPPFLDMQIITASAESIEFGFDPAIENPRDFGQRVFNYPRIWYLWLNLGIGIRATNLLAIASILLFFYPYFCYFRQKTT